MTFAKRIVRAFIPRSIRNWLRSPTMSAQWAWCGIIHAVKVNRRAQIRPDWSLLCHPAAYRFSYYAQNVDAEQIAEFDGFISACRPGMVFFDIGAHFGLFSLAAVHYGGDTAKAIAVDPSPTASRITRVQAQLNNVADRLHVVQASVGDKVGWENMVAVGVLSAGYFIAPSKDHHTSELTRTQATTLDRLAHDFKTSPTHIKIDVEGHEATVLRGAQHLLSKTEAPLLFIELHNQMVREHDGDPKQTLTLLKGFGYEIFAVDGTLLDEATILNSSLIRIVAKKTNGKHDVNASCRL